ncbi:putative histone chaperone ASF1A [Cardamine amara subsp. amara]|uniref:Histone chaperone ASF1A n=1 Tax=Cardamine amara subsp. amara TaxID=228776 RepID=A0ABD0ZPH9_CARAN
MSAINITNVAVLDNPAPFVSPFQFEISYECLNSLKDDLEWKLIYVGSAEDETYDQLLESVLVGPVNVGNYRFVLQADPPDPSRIREEDIIGVTVLLLTCSYMGQEFLRVGYYVNNDYDDEQLREEPPTKKMSRLPQPLLLPNHLMNNNNNNLMSMVKRRLCLISHQNQRNHDNFLKPSLVEKTG